MGGRHYYLEMLNTLSCVVRYEWKRCGLNYGLIIYVSAEQLFINSMVALHRKLLSLGHSDVNADNRQKVEIVLEPQTDILSVT